MSVLLGATRLYQSIQQPRVPHLGVHQLLIYPVFFQDQDIAVVIAHSPVPETSLALF